MARNTPRAAGPCRNPSSTACCTRRCSRSPSVLNADAVSLLLANDEGTELVGPVAFGLPQEVDLTVSIRAAKGRRARCWQRASPGSSRTSARST